MDIQDNITQSVAESVKEVTGLKISEGRMKELHGYIEDGLSAEEIIKKMKLKKTPDMVKFVQGLMKEGNAFGKAVTDAKKAGKKKFKFQGKEYQVEGDEVNEIEFDAVKKKLVGAGVKEEEIKEYVGPALTPANQIAKKHGGKVKAIMVKDEKGKKSKYFYVEDEEIEESTKEYAKSLEKIANDRKLKNISKKDKETLAKIADLLKRANEAIGKETVEEEIELEEMFELDRKGSTATYGFLSSGDLSKFEKIAKKHGLKPNRLSKPEEKKVGGKKYFTMTYTGKVDKLIAANKEGNKVIRGIKEEIEEAVDPRRFVLGGDTKVTKKDVDKILSKIFLNNKLAKQAETSKAYKDGFSGKVKKNPYKKDTADFHLFILGQQSAQAS